MFVADAWYVAAWDDEIGAAPLARRILDQPVVLFRDAGGTIAALDDMCLHRGAPLSRGCVVENGIECGYHGMVYAPDGRCIAIPGQGHVPAKIRVAAHPTVVRDRIVWIWMGEPAEADADAIVRVPHLSDRAHWPSKHAMYPIAAAAELMIDNLMDLSHVGFVHRSTIGGTPQSHVDAIMDVESTDRSVRLTRWLLNSPTPPTYRIALPSLAERIDRGQEFEFFPPSTVLQWTGAVDAGPGIYDPAAQTDGIRTRLFHGLTPSTSTSCFYFWSVANGFAPDVEAVTQALFDEVARAFEEDRAMVEAQQERISERGESSLVNIGTDGARVPMRRILDRLRNGREPSRA